MLAIAALTVAAAMLPVSASATAAPPAESVAEPVPVRVAEQASKSTPQLAYEGPGTCRHAWIKINARTLAVRAGKSTTAPVKFFMENPSGWRFDGCRSFEVGERYGDFCGRPNTGWILIAWPANELQGWIPNQCTQDPILG